MWLEVSLHEVTRTQVRAEIADRVLCAVCSLLFSESLLTPALGEAGAGIGAQISKMLVRLERQIINGFKRMGVSPRPGGKAA